MKQFLIFIISALFVVGCANNPPQKAENPVQPELFPDLKKFPVQKISIECTVPAPSRIRNLMDLFNGGFIHIENVYLSVDQKEVWVVAQLEVENLQAPEEIATGTVSSSVPVRAPNVPIKYYILSKKHCGMPMVNSTKTDRTSILEARDSLYCLMENLFV